MGAAVALPLLDAMTPALARGRRAAAGAAAAPGVHLRAERRHDGRLDAERRRARLRASADPEAARAVPDDMLVLSRPGAPQRRRRSATAPATTRAPARRFLTGVHPQKTAGADIQIGISVDQIAAQHIGRTTRLRVARARLRRLAHGRQLRLGLLLRLHQQPLLARPDDADAAGDQPAAGLRAPVRRLDTSLDAGERARGACATARSILDFVARAHARS